MRSDSARPTQPSSMHARRRASRMTIASPRVARATGSASSTVNGPTSAVSSAVSASEDGTVASTT